MPNVRLCMTNLKGDYLGEFEQIVLLALARLDGESYAVPIRREIEEKTGRKASLGSIYATLSRLERKGYVTSWIGEPTAERGGRSKHFFRISKDGSIALKRTRNLLLTLWDGLSPQFLDGRSK
jgi:PadR family transcriptional regulator, regulatory protein PadR